jgi:hypothetical protein
VLVTVKSAAWAGFAPSNRPASISAASRKPNARALLPAALSWLEGIVFFVPLIGGRDQASRPGCHHDCQRRSSTAASAAGSRRKRRAPRGCWEHRCPAQTRPTRIPEGGVGDQVLLGAGVGPAAQGFVSRIALRQQAPQRAPSRAGDLPSRPPPSSRCLQSRCLQGRSRPRCSLPAG